MQSTLPHDRAPRAGRLRLALASGLLAAAVTGGALLVFPLPGVQAQQPVPLGAPPSLADLVERVKGAVVSIQVTTQGPKIARNDPRDVPKGPGPEGRGNERDRQPPLAAKARAPKDPATKGPASHIATAIPTSEIGLRRCRMTILCTSSSRSFRRCRVRRRHRARVS